MKKLILILLFFGLLSCMDDPKESSDPALRDLYDNEIDSVEISQEPGFLQENEIRARNDSVFLAKDDRGNLEDLLIARSYLKIEEFYMLDLEYPLLNETADPRYKVFNNYITEKFLNINKIEEEIVRELERICDTAKSPRYPEIRKVNYRVSNPQDQYLSILFYRENYYAEHPLPSYTFETLNFDLENAEFLEYDNLLFPGSEDELLTIINTSIRQKIDSGEIYYDCWELSKEDFLLYKDNFILNRNNLEYYFDDCIICPSYTGVFSIKVPFESLSRLTRQKEDIFKP